jgi:hypothetical protein
MIKFSIKFPEIIFFLENFTKITKHRKNDYNDCKTGENKNEGGYTKCRKKERVKEGKKE